jgi:hypothetical protein
MDLLVLILFVWTIVQSVQISGLKRRVSEAINEASRAKEAVAFDQDGTAKLIDELTSRIEAMESEARVTAQ